MEVPFWETPEYNDFMHLSLCTKCASSLVTMRKLQQQYRLLLGTNVDHENYNIWKVLNEFVDKLFREIINHGYHRNDTCKFDWCWDDATFKFLACLLSLKTSLNSDELYEVISSNTLCYDGMTKVEEGEVVGIKGDTDQLRENALRMMEMLNESFV